MVEELSPRIDRDDEGNPIRVWLSAQTGAGCELLLEAISELLSDQVLACKLELSGKRGALRGALYRLNCITDEQFDDLGNWLLDIRLSMIDWNRLKKEYGNEIDELIKVEQLS